MRETAEDILGPTCEFCHGSGQPGGIKGGPELGLCSWCGGSGHSRRAVPDRVFATPAPKAGTEALKLDPDALQAAKEAARDFSIAAAKAEWDHECFGLVDQSIDAAIRAYLVQPEQPALGAEPFIWLHRIRHKSNENWSDWRKGQAPDLSEYDHPDNVEVEAIPLYTTPPVSPDVTALQAEVKRLRKALDAKSRQANDFFLENSELHQRLHSLQSRIDAAEPSKAEILKVIGEWQNWAAEWAGSAFVADEKLTNGSEENHKAELYSGLCRMMSHMMWLRDEVAALTLPKPGEVDGALVETLREARGALVDIDARLTACGPLHTAEDAYDTSYIGMVADAILSIDAALRQHTRSKALSDLAEIDRDLIGEPVLHQHKKGGRS